MSKTKIVFLYLEPNASAASSITGILYLFATSKISSIRESKLAPRRSPKNPPTSATKLEKPYSSYCSVT